MAITTTTKPELATIHKIFTPATLSNVLLHVILLSSFVALFFFSYGSRIEQQVVQTQTESVVDNLMQDVRNVATPDQMQLLRTVLEPNLQAPDMTQADQEAAAKNKQLMQQTVKVLGIVCGVSLSLIILLWSYGKWINKNQYFSGWKLLKENMVTLLFVAITEFFFVTFFAANYKSADPNYIKKKVVDTLIQYAASPSSSF